MVANQGTPLATIRVDRPTAFARALDSIHSLGGDVRWRSRPCAARFVVPATRIRYDGLLTLVAIAPNETALRLTIKPDATLLAIQVAAALVGMTTVVLTLGELAASPVALAVAWWFDRALRRTPRRIADAVIAGLRRPPAASRPSEIRASVVTEVRPVA
jgi:hypothetical protein